MALRVRQHDVVSSKEKRQDCDSAVPNGVFTGKVVQKLDGLACLCTAACHHCRLRYDGGEHASWKTGLWGEQIHRWSRKPTSEIQKNVEDQFQQSAPSASGIDAPAAASWLPDGLEQHLAPSRRTPGDAPV